MVFYGKLIKYQYRKINGQAPYALFLHELKKQGVEIPRAFTPRYKACKALWQKMIVGSPQAKKSLWARAAKTTFQRRIPLSILQFPGLRTPRAYVPNAFSKFVSKHSNGRKGVADFKKLAALYKQTKK